jgi:hypothetical protein
VADELVDVIRAINRRAPAVSFLARTLKSQLGIAEERLNPARVLPVTGGRFPFLFVNLTYAVDRIGEPQLAEIKSRGDRTSAASHAVKSAA